MAYEYITKFDSKNYTSAADTPRNYGMNRVVEGITIHHWGDPANNPQFQNVVDYLCRSGGNTSAHYVATGVGRKVACIVSPDDTAWHSGNAWGNARTIGIECDPQATAADIDVIAELVADIRSAYGDVPLYWHSYFVATICPGRYKGAILEKIDKLSYEKVSHDAWGAVTDKVPKPTVVTPVPQTPSPTAQGDPNTGVPVSDKTDYAKETNAVVKENNSLLKQILALLQQLVTKITSIFK